MYTSLIYYYKLSAFVIFVTSLAYSFPVSAYCLDSKLYLADILGTGYSYYGSIDYENITYYCYGIFYLYYYLVALCTCSIYTYILAKNGSG